MNVALGNDPVIAELSHAASVSNVVLVIAVAASLHQEEERVRLLHRGEWLGSRPVRSP